MSRSPSRKKILYVVNDAGFFLSHRLPVALAASASGFEVHVATPVSEEVRKVREAGFEYHPYPLFRSGTRVFDEGRSLLSLYRLYRFLKPDLVHHVTLKPVLYGGVAARISGVPAVVNALTGLGYVFVSNGKETSILSAVIKALLKIPLGHPNSKVIFQNPDDLNEMVEGGVIKSSSAILIRGSGVDMKVYHPVPESLGVPIVALASRMLWDKGVGDFVEAARMLRKAGVSARFVLLGESDQGNPSAIPTDQLSSWHEEGVVEWWGKRDDIPEVFAQSSLVCLPSYYREGVPKVLIEAAACGRAIVTTDAPGCREIVRNNVNGFLVPPRDVTAMVAAIRRLISDPILRKDMGAKGRQIAEAEFSLEQVVSATLAVYAELLAA